MINKNTDQIKTISGRRRLCIYLSGCSEIEGVQQDRREYSSVMTLDSVNQVSQQVVQKGL